jgi:hypothetical protein
MLSAEDQILLNCDLDWIDMNMFFSRTRNKDSRAIKLSTPKKLVNNHQVDNIEQSHINIDNLRFH